MGRATIFDAFQAVTGATQTVLDTLDKEYKAQAAIEIQNAQLQNAEAFDGFLMDMQNSGDWENYEKNWESFKAKAYNAGAQNLSSPYARKLYDSQYKEMEMRQRLTVRHAADQKRRLETVTNGYALVNRMAQSTSYIDKEVTLDDGSTVIKTAGQQKMEDIQKTLLTMYDGGLIDYAQLNQHMKDAAANVMLSDMIKAGQEAVDNMGSLEQVLDTVGNYKGAYTSVAGDTVSRDMVMDKAKGAAASYFKEKQALRYQESEQGSSKIYAELLPALSKGNMDAAVEIAKKGLAYIQAQDEKYGGDGMSAALRDEYVQKFSIFDNIRKLGSGGQYAAFAQMKKNDIVGYLHVLRVNGIEITDKDGKKRVEYFSAKQLLEHVRNDIIPKMIEAQPENEPLIQSQWGDALFDFVDTLLKPPYAPAGVAEYVQDLDKTVEAIMRERLGKEFKSPEGQAELLYMQAFVKSQVSSHAADFTVKDGRLNVDGIQKIVHDAIDSAYTKDLKVKPKGKEAARLAEAQSNTREQGPFGENIETEKSKAQKGQLRNVAVKELMKMDNLSETDVLKKYRFSERDDGSVLVTDSNGKPVYMATQGVDKKGKETYGLQTINKTDDGRAYLAQPEKTADEAAKETKDFEGRFQSIEWLDFNAGIHTTKRFSDAFKIKISNIAPEDRELFEKIVNQVQNDILNGSASYITKEDDIETQIFKLFNEKKKGAGR